MLAAETVVISAGRCRRQCEPLTSASSFPAYLNHLQGILKKMAASSTRPPPRMSIESGPFTFHYLIDGDVVFLTLAEKAYPKKLAFQYLDELQNEFSRLYGGQIEAVTRPYAFIKFGEPEALVAAAA